MKEKVEDFKQQNCELTKIHSFIKMDKSTLAIDLVDAHNTITALKEQIETLQFIMNGGLKRDDQL